MRDRLETDRLVLRELVLSDASRISELASDYDIGKMTGSFPNPYPLLSAEFWVMKIRAQVLRGKCHAYAITKLGDDTLIGTVDLFTNGDDNLEIGYWLGRPYWGQGYASEAGATILTEADRLLANDFIEAGFFSDNAASGHVLEKLGFEYTGKDDFVFSMTRLTKAPGKRMVRQRAA